VKTENILVCHIIQTKFALHFHFELAGEFLVC